MKKASLSILLQAHAMLAQLDKHQTEITEVPSSMCTGDNILLYFFVFT